MKFVVGANEYCQFWRRSYFSYHIWAIIWWHRRVDVTHQSLGHWLISQSFIFLLFHIFIIFISFIIFIIFIFSFSLFSLFLLFSLLFILMVWYILLSSSTRVEVNATYANTQNRIFVEASNCSTASNILYFYYFHYFIITIL